MDQLLGRTRAGWGHIGQPSVVMTSQTVNIKATLRGTDVFSSPVAEVDFLKPNGQCRLLLTTSVIYKISLILYNFCTFFICMPYLVNLLQMGTFVGDKQ